MSIVDFPAWPARIILNEPFGAALDRELDRVGVTRGFILASASLARAALLPPVGARIAGLRAGMAQHSPQTDILDIAAAARSCGADAVISIGGGSVIDAAKLVQAALAEDLADLPALAAWRKARRGSPARKIPHIAVPTTLSGAEFTWFAGARHPETGLKQAFAARWMIPSTILFDPALALHTPARLWLSTGLRAIDHAIEALLSDRCNPLAETLCLEGVGRMLAALETCRTDPEERASRAAAQTAAWFCATGLMSAVPMGASHAFGHVIGSLFDVPHGITSCVMLPAIMAFNAEAVPARLARLMPLFGADPAEGLRRRIAALGLPTRLSEIGIGPAQHEAIVAGLSDEAWLASNPRPVAGREDIEAILYWAA